MSERAYEVVQLDELERIPVGEQGLLWRPVRRRLGIEAFGVNAYTADEAGQEVVEHHDETGAGAGKHEELYVVLRGRATFTLEDDEVDAPPGTFVFVRDRTVRRGAIAEEPGTAVLALGGIPGRAFEVSPWEYVFASLPPYHAKDYPEAIKGLRQGLERHPDNPSLLFSLACLHSLNGDRETALEYLSRAVEADPRIVRHARTDPDLDPIRDDPRFESAVAGKPDSGGETA